MKKAILIINICKDPLHYYEFVKPIEDILGNNKIGYKTKKYGEIKGSDIKKADKVIICGTSLKDFDYFNHFEKFSWIRLYMKPILGICGGMEILVKLFGGEIWGSGKKIKDREEIGFMPIKFSNGFLGVEAGMKEVYSLHQLGVRKVRKEFIVFAMSNKGIQAIKHKTKPVYATLFHPEVRNKEIIVNFCSL